MLNTSCYSSGLIPVTQMWHYSAQRQLLCAPWSSLAHQMVQGTPGESRLTSVWTIPCLCRRIVRTRSEMSNYQNKQQGKHSKKTDMQRKETSPASNQGTELGTLVVKQIIHCGLCMSGRHVVFLGNLDVVLHQTLLPSLIFFLYTGPLACSKLSMQKRSPRSNLMKHLFFPRSIKF